MDVHGLKQSDGIIVLIILFTWNEKDYCFNPCIREHIGHSKSANNWRNFDRHHDISNHFRLRRNYSSLHFREHHSLSIKLECKLTESQT